MVEEGALGMRQLGRRWLQERPGQNRLGMIWVQVGALGWRWHRVWWDLGGLLGRWRLLRGSGIGCGGMGRSGLGS